LLQFLITHNADNFVFFSKITKVSTAEYKFTLVGQLFTFPPRRGSFRGITGEEGLTQYCFSLNIALSDGSNKTEENFQT
jgi:hypothetical protein